MENPSLPQANERFIAVKLVVGLLYPTGMSELKEWAVAKVTEPLGGVERESADYIWGYTDYYRDISPDLTRSFFSIAGLRHPRGLPDWKKLAVRIEEASAAFGGSRRRVNIDPGYADGARLVLASTKDNAQRIYLRDGIYAEVTMCRSKSGWEKFHYTFPDFKSGVYDGFFDLVRQDWRRDIRAYKELMALDR